ncbi:hypothetical protein I79_014948 [Cricetulus griseus]|uniref:Uncharacterized protein n=1 Tax=Cricetulus griseus TaxID=10029 RepID=G3HVG1_CRIGR|nr:hypothetical protein I79_014948 [Cricetulus griseus]
MVSALASSSLAEDRKKEDSEKLNAFVRDCDLLEDKNQREHEEGVPSKAAKGCDATVHNKNSPLPPQVEQGSRRWLRGLC